MPRPIIALLPGVLLLLAGCTTTGGPAGTADGPTSARTDVPTPAHVVIVIEENRSSAEAVRRPYFAHLAATGADLTDMKAEVHPSQPNYLALWSGSTQSVVGDGCPHDLGRADSLGEQLLHAGRTTAVYSEGLPEAGFPGCAAGRYARKHNPLADFSATASPAHDLPLTAFPKRYADLPDVSLVIPDLDHDAHDGSVAVADAWLEEHLGGYVRWAQKHDSLFLLTFDEDDGSSGNHILTVLTGEHVKRGRYAEPANHVALLHTLETAYGLPLLGDPAPPLIDLWD